MAPNKLDNQIREKLNARDIQPSAPAWDRLDAMLAVSEEKKSKKGYGWFFVAASTLLFLDWGFSFSIQTKQQKLIIQTQL